MLAVPVQTRCAETPLACAATPTRWRSGSSTPTTTCCLASTTPVRCRMALPDLKQLADARTATSHRAAAWRLCGGRQQHAHHGDAQHAGHVHQHHGALQSLRQRSRHVLDAPAGRHRRSPGWACWRATCSCAPARMCRRSRTCQRHHDHLLGNDLLHAPRYPAAPVRRDADLAHALLQRRRSAHRGWCVACSERAAWASMI